MKKIISVFTMFIILALPFGAFAQDSPVPMLLSVEFNNATVSGEFSPENKDYEIVVDNSGKTPTLADCEVTDGATATVTYENAEGINIDVKKDGLTNHYFFKYVGNISHSSNSKLMSLECNLCEVYPAISENRTKYDLYIPSDMTDIKVVAIPQDISASCSAPNLTLSAEQTMKFEVTVKASDDSSTVYSFNIKRLDKTMAEVEEIMADENFTSLVEGELFYQKPAFKIICASVSGALVLIIIVTIILRKLVVKIEDDEEFEFFDFEEPLEDEELENDEEETEDVSNDTP